MKKTTIVNVVAATVAVVNSMSGSVIAPEIVTVIIGCLNIIMRELRK